MEIDFFIDYCNVLEFKRFKHIHNLIKDSNTRMIALKPFDGGNVFKQNYSLENSLNFLVNFNSTDGTIASLSSIEQFDKIWDFNYDIP